MTLKQFTYVAGGAIIGFSFLCLARSFLIKIPLALVWVGAGAAFAFVPFEGRPLDVMIKNFFKRLFIRLNMFIKNGYPAFS